ncbi:hypothetical protein J6590_000161 [Homalodisca vitripennis]|nr:hypothetical protein J6590_000161 [Homalodisca vitripennis]
MTETVTVAQLCVLDLDRTVVYGAGYVTQTLSLIQHSATMRRRLRHSDSLIDPAQCHVRHLLLPRNWLRAGVDDRDSYCGAVVCTRPWSYSSIRTRYVTQNISLLQYSATVQLLLLRSWPRAKVPEDNMKELTNNALGTVGLDCTLVTVTRHELCVTIARSPEGYVGWTLLGTLCHGLYRFALVTPTG